MFSDEQNSVKQSLHWEADSYSVSQEILCLLWSKSLLPHTQKLTIRHMNALNTFTTYFTKTPFNIILPSTIQSPFQVTPTTVLYVLMPPFLCQYDSWLFHHTNNILWTVLTIHRDKKNHKRQRDKSDKLKMFYNRCLFAFKLQILWYTYMQFAQYLLIIFIHV